MDGLQGLFDQYEVPVILEDHRSPGRSIDVAFNGVLRPEQEPAARARRHQSFFSSEVSICSSNLIAQSKNKFSAIDASPDIQLSFIPNEIVSNFFYIGSLF